MIFWSEDSDEHARRREREAGEEATRRQRMRDGYATFRIQAMKERPPCQHCGRNYAWVQYHDKRYCMGCAPCEVESIKPSDYIDQSERRAYRKCGLCGRRFPHPESQPRVYCTPECEGRQQRKTERQRLERIARLGEERADLERRIVTRYEADRRNVKEIGVEFTMSSYQVSEVLKRHNVRRRTKTELAQMQRERFAP